MNNVWIVDDHDIFRDGVSALMDDLKDISLSQNLSSAEELLSYLEVTTQFPDVILMDISMKEMNGIKATEFVRKHYPEIKIVILSMHDESKYVFSALEAGADGYVLKDRGFNELVEAVEAVSDNKTYFSQEISTVITRNFKNWDTAKKNSKTNLLTKRELEVLQLIAEENTNGEIAQALFISIRTVDTHRRNLLEKLSKKNTAGLVRYAIEIGLIK